KRQQAFFEQGVMAMQPMVLKDVADEVGLHESTVSRITTSKTIVTPKGLFSLKYFFSSQVSSDEVEGVSSTAISAMIKQMIEAEDPKKP
ncbi:RNA polymerase factor sigma-54, partial [Klebsiella pneumoniae]